MRTLRYPVLLWRDHSGGFTAAPVEDLGYGSDETDGLVTLGRSAREALSQLTEYLNYRAREDGWLPTPRVKHLSRIEYVVHLRPVYQEQRRIFPADRNFRLRVECVLGRFDEELHLASLPQLGLRLHYFSGDPVRELVSSRLAQLCEGWSPGQLSRLLPPRLYFLDEVVVKAPTGSGRRWKAQVELKALEAVADPLDGPRSRGRFGQAWERDAEVADLVERLGRDRSNLLICGERGGGKTTALAEAVRRLAQGYPREAPRRYWLTSAARLIAGMKYLGQWQVRCQQIIEELNHAAGALCVESLLDLLTVGGSGPGDSVAAFLATYLQAGELRLVAEATPTELEACRRLLPGLIELMPVLEVGELDRRRSVAVLDRIAAQRARLSRSVTVERGVTEQLYHLFKRFYPYGAFPGRASRFLLDLLDEAGRGERPEVTRAAAVSLFIRRTGLPEVFLRDELLLEASEVFEHLRGEVLGQDAACQVAADVVCTFKAGMTDPGQPVAVLLFCGPTGVGKTQLARSLARYCFGHSDDGDRLLRLDMSEYSGAGAAQRLLGEVGSEGSPLLAKVRHQPFLVLLLDEVEKAAPEVFDVLLGVLDEGRLTDAYGRLTDFRSVILIMTSNLGARTTDPVGFAPSAGADFSDAVARFFRPEFINRVDEIVPFSSLSPETIRAITEKELRALGEREGLQRRALRLTWSEELVSLLAREGYSARYGARDLQRTIEGKLVVPLAHFLLDHAELRRASLEASLDQEGAVCFRVGNRPEGETKVYELQ